MMFFHRFVGNFRIFIDKRLKIFYHICGNILATENQQARIIDVIEVKTGVYLQINTVKNSKGHAEFE